MVVFDYVMATEETKKHADIIKSKAEELSLLCDKRLKNPDKFSFSSRNDLMITIEKLSLEIYSNAKKVGYPPTVDKSVLNRYEYLKDYIEILNVNEDYIHFKMPMLPSKNANKDLSGAAVNYAFNAILEQYGYIPKMDEHYLVFTHVYPSSHKKSQILDSDNYEATQAINTTMMHIQSTDIGVNSWHINRTVVTDKVSSGTYVEIIRRVPDNAVSFLDFLKK